MLKNSNAITLSTTMDYVMRKTGLYFLPNPLLKEHMEKIILNESLVTFSKFYPYIDNVRINCKYDACPNKPIGYYFIRPEDENLTDIIAVAHMYKSTNMYDANLLYMEKGSYAYTGNPYDLMAVQATQNVASMFNYPSTFLFHAPNILEVFPKNTRITPYIDISVKFVHPRTLITIPLGLREQWLRLVEYDIKISLYEILKLYENRETPFGNINLHIDNWSNAESQRDDLLTEMRANFIKEPNRKKIYFNN